MSYVGAIGGTIQKLQTGVAGFAEEGSATPSDAALAGHIGQLVVRWDQLDASVTRMANTVIARTFAVSEVGRTS